MAVPHCELDGASIVLVGSFNPAIFHPSWLGSHNLLRAGEVEKAQVPIVSQEISSFTVEWLTIQVTRERFQVSSNDARYFEPLRDLVFSIFTILEHTPVSQIGINRDMHFPSTQKAMNNLADLLVDRSVWRDHLENPLLETLVIIGKRTDSKAKAYRFTVQPSMRVTPGIYVGSNEHFQARDGHTPSEIIRLLTESWTDSLRHAAEVAGKLLSGLS
jgi:hypothetical protein